MNLSFLKRIMFTLSIFVIFLVILELVMIFLEPALFQGFYQYDPDIGFRIRPYACGTNQFGFNDRDYEIPNPQKAFRLLVLGDSFGWAGAQEWNYTAILERKLSSLLIGKPIEVINTGYPMTHTAEQYQILRKFGMQYEPDKVILGFFAGNDFIDADPDRKRIVVNDTFFDISRKKEKTLFGFPIVTKSRFYYFLKQRLNIRIERFRSGSKPKDWRDGWHDSGEFSFSEQTFLQLEYNRMAFCNREYHRNKWFDPKINFIKKAILSIQAICDLNDCKFFVAVFPDEFQVNDTLYQATLDYFQSDPAQYDRYKVQSVLISFLEENNIEYLDMLSAFQKHQKVENLYLDRNTHWNRKGNELAAKLLYQNLYLHDWNAQN